jgi:hypothetical protein
MTKITKEMVAKVKQGDPVSDDELEILLKEFRSLHDILSVLGAEFYLARVEVLRNLIRFEDWDRHRKSQKNAGAVFKVSPGVPRLDP